MLNKPGDLDVTFAYPDEARLGNNEAALERMLLLNRICRASI
jgi:hypothetical protein